MPHQEATVDPGCRQWSTPLPDEMSLPRAPLNERVAALKGSRRRSTTSARASSYRYEIIILHFVPSARRMHEVTCRPHAHARATRLRKYRPEHSMSVEGWFAEEVLLVALSPDERQVLISSRLGQRSPPPGRASSSTYPAAPCR